jgi:hypothetical protein
MTQSCARGVGEFYLREKFDGGWSCEKEEETATLRGSITTNLLEPKKKYIHWVTEFFFCYKEGGKKSEDGREEEETNCQKYLTFYYFFSLDFWGKGIMLGTKPRPSHILGNHPTTESQP